MINLSIILYIIINNVKLSEVLIFKWLVFLGWSLYASIYNTLYLMLENLNQTKYSILCSIMSYIFHGSVLYFTVCILNDDNTINSYMYIQMGKNGNCKQKA